MIVCSNKIKEYKIYKKGKIKMEKNWKKNQKKVNNQIYKKIFYICLVPTICSIVLIGIMIWKIVTKDYSNLLIGELGQIFTIVISAIMWDLYFQVKRVFDKEEE